jgi:hypothetical protein
MTLKLITKQGDCFYIGEHLVAVYLKTASTIVFLSQIHNHTCQSAYIGNVGELTLQRFEKEFCHYLYLFFCKINEEYFLCSSLKSWQDENVPSFGVSGMLEMTEEEEKTYYVYDDKVVRGKANISFLKKSCKDYEVIEIEESTRRNGVNLFAEKHYLFAEQLRWYSNVKLLRESKRTITADYYYMISDENILRVMHMEAQVAYNTYKSFVMTPQRIYPYFPRVTSKTRVERCEELDNIYRLLDSQDDSNIVLGKILLKQFHKQTKHGQRNNNTQGR